MNRRWTTALAILLSIGVVAVTGCQKKTPKGAQKAATPQTTTQQSPKAAPVAEDGTLTIGPLTAKLPTGWTSVAPDAPMRKAQLMISPLSNDSIPGMITVFYFGPAAGSVDQNIDRWVGQFEQADGSPLKPEMVNRETFETNGLEVTMVSFSGTQKASQMPGSAQMHPLKGFSNVSGIVVTPDGPWFFKGIGPEALMMANKAGFKNFLKSLQYNGEPSGNPHSSPHGSMGK